MRILAIEDDPDFWKALSIALEDSNILELVLAEDATAGLKAIRSREWDLVICDLKLPVEVGTPADITHGETVYSTSASECPGTPIRVLTGFGSFENAAKVTAIARQDDPFGENRDRQMIHPFAKHQLLELAVEVKGMAVALASLQQIEFADGMSAIDLDDAEARVIRVFAQRHAGRVVRIKEMRGGLSKSRTLRVVVEDMNGARASSVIAKLGAIARVVDERRRYNQYIAPNLDATTFAPMAGFVTAGPRNLGGLFYSVAESAESLFDILGQDPDRAVAVVERLQADLQPWRVGVPAAPTTVREIRQVQISDGELLDVTRYLDGIPWEAAEATAVQARVCTTHGDLHGGNVLVLDRDRPILIDYGRTGRTSVAIDPVMLEFSLLLHPEGRLVVDPWPSTAQAAHWTDVEGYLQDCPVGPFVRACRSWAFAAAAGDREIYACVYAYGVRQLMFDRTDKDLAVAIVRRAIERLVA